MQRMLWALCLAGCGSSAAEVPAELVVEGDWSLTASKTAGTCPVEGSVFPVGPGLTHIRAADGAVELANEGELITYAVRGREWRRDRSVALEECTADISETWVLHSVAGRRLSASYAVEVRARGDCAAYGVDSCRVDYGVWGVQP